MFGAGHGGRGEQGADALCAGQTNQGPAIVKSVFFAQGGDGGLVAGQFSVVAGDDGCGPDQGIVPVDTQADAPDNGPRIAGASRLI